MDSQTTLRKIKALRLHGNHDIRIETIPPTLCGPDEVRVNVEYCGICGSDLHEYLEGPIIAPKPGQTHPFTGCALPVVMGHEISGVISELGKCTTGLSLGQKVAINPVLHDKQHGRKACQSCSNGRPNICAHIAYYGVGGPGGGFSEEIVVKASNVYPLPDGVSLREGALVEPLAVAWHSIRLSKFQRGQDALVLGAGPIGLALILILKSWGARSILVSETIQKRRDQAKAFGATDTIDPTHILSDDFVKAARATSADNAGVHVAFDAIGLQTTFDTAIAATRPGGTIYNIAIHREALAFDPNNVTLAEKVFTGGIAYTHEDFVAVICALNDGSLATEGIVTSIVPLNDVIEGGFRTLLLNKKDHIKILIQPRRPI